MKVKYIGESFQDAGGLTNDQIYECLGVEEVVLFEDLGNITMLKIIDDSGRVNTYSPANPCPNDIGKFKGGRWEIIEDQDKLLENIIPKHEE